MWEQWETVARSSLSSLEHLRISMLESPLRLTKPPFVPISSLSKRDRVEPEAYWLDSVLVLNPHTSVTKRETPQPGLAFFLPLPPPRHPRSVPAGAWGGQTCVRIIHVWLQSCSSCRWELVGYRDQQMFSAFLDLDFHTGFSKTKGSFEKPPLEMFGPLSWLTLWGFE